MRTRVIIGGSAFLVGALLAVTLPATAAFGNAGNPLSGTSGTATINADGTVTVHLQGNWSWPDQQCSGRYGIGWAVDWWGIGTSRAPDPSFSLSGASEVVDASVAPQKPWTVSDTVTGTVTPTGSIQLRPPPPPPPPPPGQPKPPPPPPMFFHVGQYYAGEDTDLCAQTEADGTPFGTWTAVATYPDRADIPSALCVNIYDEHGSAGKSSGNPKDFSPSGDGDNSIQTNDFDPDPADGSSCMLSSALVVSGGGPPN